MVHLLLLTAPLQQELQVLLVLLALQKLQGTANRNCNSMD
jgi:hypothetical protein